MTNARGSWIRGAVVYAVALCSFAIGTVPARAQAGAVLRGAGTFGDLDGDHRADFAVAEPQGFAGHPHSYRVNVQLSANPNSTFEIDSQAPGGLHVTALDVDGDHDLDLVITTEFGRVPVGVWINDGRGAFAQGDASAYPSSIWRQPANSWDVQERKLPARAEVSTAAAGWTIEVCGARASLPDADDVLYVAAARPATILLYGPGGLRAPPLV